MDAAVALAQAVNLRIYEIATAFAVRADDSLVDFVCDCGCMAVVMTTLAAYAAGGGAWLEGHMPAGAPDAR